MKVKVYKSDDAESYTLEREDGETLITADLVLLRSTKKEWEEMEYEPRTAMQALALLREHIDALRPGNKPSKKQMSAAGLAVKKVNKLCKKVRETGNEFPLNK